MKKDRRGLVILILAAVVLVLLGVLSYAMFLKPAFSGYVVNAQTAGVQYGYEQTILTIMQQASTCQAVPLTYGNQTINLVAVECFQQ